MVSNKNVREDIEKLENLKVATLDKYLEEIDLDSEIDLYDVMINHFINGDLFDYYLSDNLNDMSENEKKKLFKLVNEYIGLCFYNQDFNNWLDSVEMYRINDYDLISMNILENYDFLLRIAKNGGREVLDFLVKFVNESGYSDSSVIEYLRNTFNNDDILEWILLEMASKNSLYNIFDYSQKAKLLSYPEGVLYSSLESEENSVDMKDVITFKSPLKLSLEILKLSNVPEINYDNESDISNVAINISSLLPVNDDFSDIVRMISLNYNKERRKLFRKNDVSIVVDDNREIMWRDNSIIFESFINDREVKHKNYLN